MQSALAVLNCHLWPGRHYNIFPHYFVNGTTFGEKVIEYKNVFCFPLQPLSEVLLIIRIIEWYATNVHRSS